MKSCIFLVEHRKNCVFRFFQVLCLFCMVVSAANSASQDDCPVCFRMMDTVLSSSLTKSGKASDSYERYCRLESISVDESQFCYNTNGIKAEIHRLLDMGADAARICKKVKKVNPDFCTTKESEYVVETSHLESNAEIESSVLANNTRFKPKRGFVYI